MGHPEDVIAYLSAGNERYAAGRVELRDWAAERVATAELQEPIAAVLGCADSRVPVETVFDCGLGDLIVVRTAGHVLDDAALKSLGFAVEELGVGAIVVLGHSKCAAVSKAFAPTEAGSAADWLGSKVTVSIAGAGEVSGTPNGAEIAHARETAKRLGDGGSIRAAVERGDLVVCPALYDVASGRVTWL